MTSVELLERAAAKLRELAEPTQRKYEWCPDYTWAAVRHVERNCDVECEAHGDDQECWSFGRYDGKYVALMHPSVALALADWLEAEAATIGIPEPSVAVQWAAAAVARAILREAL